MPETIRAANERLRSRPRRGDVLVGFLVALSYLAQAAPARAGALALPDSFSQPEIAGLALSLGLLCFSVLATILLLRMRKRTERLETAAREEAAALRAETDRLKALLLSQPQVLVAWAAATDKPEIIGDVSIVTLAPVPERVLAFGAWLDPAEAQRMQQAVDALREHGRGFVMTLTSKAGRPIEAEGRAIGGAAILRLRDVSGIEREMVELAARQDALLADVEIMRALFELLAGAGVGAR